MLSVVHAWLIVMQRNMRSRLLRSLLLIALLVLSIGGLRYVRHNNSQYIALQPLPLDPQRPALKTVGGLTFLNAWQLNSDNSDFGGISALMALRDGRFIGLSDAGTLIGFGLTNNNRADHPFIAPLPGTTGPDIGYEDRDSEGIAHDPATGQFWISYEGKHAIRRFNPSFSRIDGKYTAREMLGWGSNSGAETIVRLPDGRFAVISEGMDMPDGSYMALMFSGDPVEPGSSYFAFGYRPPDGYKATDAAVLPNGMLLILNRRIAFPHGFSAKLTVVGPSEIARGQTVRGKLLATLASPLLVDNMEGLAITQENDRTIIWMISDNNFNAWQRTILMKFALTPPKDAAPTKKPEAIAAPGFDSL
jgi:hypothetical protein